mmetsp:Transcript_18943/g.72988  ORF Transcript_18943/g.72988 Transcript_18943/m.72988 type:complete len:262 (-) Transcript_18943:488-1273(-)
MATSFLMAASFSLYFFITLIATGTLSAFRFARKMCASEFCSSSTRRYLFTNSFFGFSSFHSRTRSRSPVFTDGSLHGGFPFQRRRLMSTSVCWRYSSLFRPDFSSLFFASAVSRRWSWASLSCVRTRMELRYSIWLLASLPISVSKKVARCLTTSIAQLSRTCLLSESTIAMRGFRLRFFISPRIAMLLNWIRNRSQYDRTSELVGFTFARRSNTNTILLNTWAVTLRRRSSCTTFMKSLAAVLYWTNAASKSLWFSSAFP